MHGIGGSPVKPIGEPVGSGSDSEHPSDTGTTTQPMIPLSAVVDNSPAVSVYERSVAAANMKPPASPETGIVPSEKTPNKPQTVRANEQNLAEMLTPDVPFRNLKEPLEKLSRQLNKLHIEFIYVPEVNKLKDEIGQLLNGETELDRNRLKHLIANSLLDIVIWAAADKENVAVLTYLIEQGFSIPHHSSIESDNINCLDPFVEIIIPPLPFEIMERLVDNCRPQWPETMFIRAIFSDADPRFATLVDKLMKRSTNRPKDNLLWMFITNSLRTASLETLQVFFDHLRQEKCTNSKLAQELAKHNFGKAYHHLLEKVEFYPALTMVFTLEAIAQKNREKVLQLFRKLSKGKRQAIARISVLGGLHQCAGLLSELGVTITEGMCKKTPAVNLCNSPFLLAKEAGLTNKRYFVATVNQLAPFLWSLPDLHGRHPLKEFLTYWHEDEARPFIRTAIEQLAVRDEIPPESMQWVRPSLSALDAAPGELVAIYFTVAGAAPLDKAGGFHLIIEQEVYAALLSKVESCNGLKKAEDFVRFMDWLLLEGEALIRGTSGNKAVEKQLTSQLKSWRPDLWPEPDDLTSLTGGQHNSFNHLEEYIRTTRRPHLKLCESFLRAAPSDYRCSVLNSWLNDPACEQQRKKLFPRRLHPINATQEPFPWHSLLTLDQDYQLPKNPFADQWQTLGSRPQWTPPPPEVKSLLNESVEVAGRTLIIPREEGGWDYLKFLSNTETPEDLAKEGDKIRFMATIASQLGLKSTIPSVVGSYCWDDLQNDLDLIPSAKKDRLEEKCRYVDGATGYCLHLTSSADAPYHLYPYDLDPDTQADEILGGFYKYAHDFGRLFDNELISPPVMAADHDEQTNRKHYIFAPYGGAVGEGRVLLWKQALEHPNVGPVGMRDSGDTKSLKEMGKDYFFSWRSPIILDFEESEDRAKVAFSELAKNAQGLVLQYARCFQKQFNPASISSTQSHEVKIKKVLTTLFQNAFPRLTADDVEQAMDEDGLLSQAVREIVYWCGHDASFVDDILNGRISKTTYPALPDTACVRPLLDQDKELVPGIGVVTRDNQANIGITYGVNPLMALNAVILKLLAKGVLTTTSSD